MVFRHPIWAAPAPSVAYASRTPQGRPLLSQTPVRRNHVATIRGDSYRLCEKRRSGLLQKPKLSTKRHLHNRKRGLFLVTQRRFRMSLDKDGHSKEPLRI